MQALIMSSKYLGDDFKAEFGRVIPSFLPFNGKRLYEYQAALFPTNTPLYLAMPKGFDIESQDRDRQKKLGINPLFVKGGISLGEALVYCIYMIECTQDLFILFGDTYFESLEFMLDSVQIAKTYKNYKWDYVGDLNQSYADHILAGGFYIKSPIKLIKYILKSEYDFVSGLRKYIKSTHCKFILNHTWLDFGILTNYFHNKRIINTQRGFNTITSEGYYIEKSSTNTHKIKAEIMWFSNLPKSLEIYTPRFFPKENSYALEYLYCNTLSELFVFGNLPPFVWEHIMESCKEFLEILHSQKFNAPKENLDFNYFSKTYTRLESFLASGVCGIEMKRSFKFNGKFSPSLYEILCVLESFIVKTQRFVPIHGDFCFSNIMFDFRANLIKTFDPRGMDFSNKITSYGDIRYDVAKLCHSAIGLYDIIIAGYANAKICGNCMEFSFNYSQTNRTSEAFVSVFAPSVEVQAIMISLFLSMLPLHNENPKRQIALLANAVRLFLEFFDK